mmetsp:Transcript_165/g.473  ORF Transcript_165/g.473 Transcript_165/m.473 type:complete len:108 (-) Transcript_165:1380-1703(-)
MARPSAPRRTPCSAGRACEAGVGAGAEAAEAALAGSGAAATLAAAGAADETAGGGAGAGAVVLVGEWLSRLKMEPSTLERVDGGWRRAEASTLIRCARRCDCFNPAS